MISSQAYLLPPLNTIPAPDRGGDILSTLLFAGIGIYVFWIWLQDYRADRAGKPVNKPFPGATATTYTAVVIAIVGALILLLLETAGEYALGISAEQKTISAIFLLSMIAAAFVEELVFRGFLVVTSKGKAILIASVIGFSLLFALLHPFLWDWQQAEDASWWDGTLALDFSLKAWFSTVAIFVGSLWFYAVRFLPSNPKWSLIPCFAAHLTKNIGVFVIKWMQGFVV